MNELIAKPDTLIAMAHTKDERKRVALVASELIRAAAELTIDGPSKAVAVREGIKRAVFPDGVFDNELRAWVADLLGVKGFVGTALKGFLRFLPIGKIVDALIDFGVKTAYEGMKKAGLAL